MPPNYAHFRKVEHKIQKRFDQGKIQTIAEFNALVNKAHRMIIEGANF